jgi:hypothetical protein
LGWNDANNQYTPLNPGMWSVTIAVSITNNDDQSKFVQIQYRRPEDGEWLSQGIPGVSIPAGGTEVISGVVDSIWIGPGYPIEFRVQPAAGQGGYDLTINTTNTFCEVKVIENIPNVTFMDLQFGDIKVLDFLKGLQQQFNLVFDNNKGTEVTMPVYLNDQQAAFLDVNANTRMDLETTLLRKGELTPRFETNEVWGDAGVFKYQVTRPGGNTGQIQVLIKNDNGSYIKLSKWQDQNGNFNNFSNATQATEVMKGIINNAHNIFPNRQTFLQVKKM